MIDFAALRNDTRARVAFGKRVKAERIRLGLTQWDLGMAIGDLTQRQIEDVEYGSCRKTGIMRRVAAAVEIQP